MTVHPKVIACTLVALVVVALAWAFRAHIADFLTPLAVLVGGYLTPSSSKKEKLMSAYGSVIVNAIKNNKDAIVTFISTNEGVISTEAKQLVANLPKPKGIVGIIFPIVQAEVESEIDRLVNQGDPETIYNLLLAEAERL